MSKLTEALSAWIDAPPDILGPTIAQELRAVRDCEQLRHIITRCQRTGLGSDFAINALTKIHDTNLEEE